MRPNTAHCPCCFAPTFRSDLRSVEGDVAVVLGVRDDAEVCRWCEARGERELDAAADALATDGDAAADALDADPDFGSVCDARRASYLAHASVHQGVSFAAAVL